jgi:DNA topoisomerase II
MDELRVDVDPAAGRISVWNNGAGVPVEIHKGEGVYVPELIFGHLLTSSNYDDAEKKVTGGRNGYGAKLANIFSTEFVVETADGARKKRYRQRFTNNMGIAHPPSITPCSKSDNWTCVSFVPDLPKFGMTELEADAVALMRKRAVDMAGVLGRTVAVYFNGARVPVRSFSEYVKLFLPPDTPRASLKVNDRWEVAVAPSDGQFCQVSFVNAIATTKGGTHVNVVVDQVAKSIADALAKKHRGSGVKPFMVKNYLAVFVNAQIENPAFDSQVREMERGWRERGRKGGRWMDLIFFCLRFVSITHPLTHTHTFLPPLLLSSRPKKP